MQFIQARRLNNKLGVKDNSFFAIDKVTFIDSGFLLTLTNDMGQPVYLAYQDLKEFREDFNVLDNMKELVYEKKE